MPVPPLLTILLPVRNAVRDLPGFLESASRYADAIVALDDGSTDDTRAILAAHPLVKVLLTNPVRGTYSGWNDAGNRNATLRGAARLNAVWVLSLDADERVDAADGAVLRSFLETDALPGLAYGFERFEMRGPDQHLPVGLWQHRLFAYEPGQRFPSTRLHFPPIPVSIPSAAYVSTTLRIQHFGGSTLERRRVQYEKYRLTDPDCLFWPNYTMWLHDDPTKPPVPWVERPPDLLVVGSSEVTDHRPAESLTVLAPPGHPAFHLGFDGVEWIASTSPAPLLDRDLLESVGGSIVLALTPELRPRAGAFEAIIAGHAEGYALVAPVLHGTGGGSAVDRRRFEITARRPAGSVLDQPPVWCSYRRTLLLEVLDRTPPDSMTALNQRLHRDGHLCVQSEARLDAVVTGRWSTLSTAVGAFRDGCDGAAAALERHRLAGRLLRPPRVRGPRYIPTQPIIAHPEPTPVGLVQRLGAVAMLARPSSTGLSILLGAPQQVALWDLRDRDERRLALVSWSIERGGVRWVWIPVALEVERSDGEWVALGDAIPFVQRLRRFELHELVAHPLGVNVDEHVRLEITGGFGAASDFVRSIALPTLRAMSSVETSIDRVSLTLALLSSLRVRHERISPWPVDRRPGRLDSEAAAAVGRFFAGHREPDLGTLRDQVRHSRAT